MCLTLNRNLIADIVNMRKKPIVAICTDTINFYSRVAYPFTILCVQCFRIEVSYILELLRTIQMMKIFLYALF